LADERLYPKRPFLAVSAAILRDGKVLIVRRARKPALGVYTLPGGVVEAGETLEQAIVREVKEETALDIAPVTLAGHRWLGGEPALNEELDEARWVDPAELAGLKTTDGLADIVAAAMARLP
jgi:NADH pyrophosphatase NudC (nudix superfamily)